MHHSHIDRFAQGHSVIHALDARTKLLAVLAYAAVLISYDRHALWTLAPMCVMPLGMLWLGRVPLWFALRRVAALSPMILIACLLSIFAESQRYRLGLGPWQFTLSSGQIVAINIAAKFVLALLALTALTGTTPFSQLLQAMRRLCMPRLLVMQLGLVYRYLFVLIDQAMRLRRCRDLRAGQSAPLGRKLAAAGSMAGSLLVRTIDRGQRVDMAMRARLFDGAPRSLATLRFTWADAAALAAAAIYLVFCRLIYPRVF
ncbi:MAG: cobalt ECF transporter T component CbiQ [Planctomycetaceae bacterium]|nr:cobalt ECF transporter T component CbiQ [Planctomycetaceae bacterium]